MITIIRINKVFKEEEEEEEEEGQMDVLKNVGFVERRIIVRSKMRKISLSKSQSICFLLNWW